MKKNENDQKATHDMCRDDFSSLLLEIAEQGGELPTVTDALTKAINLPVLIEDNSFRLLACSFAPMNSGSSTSVSEVDSSLDDDLLITPSIGDDLLMYNRILKRSTYSEHLMTHNDFSYARFPSSESIPYDFTVFPLKFRHQILGNLTVIHHQSLTENELLLLANSAVFTSVLLYERQSSVEKEAVIRNGIMRDLLHGTGYANENIQFWLQYFHYEDTARYQLFVIDISSAHSEDRQPFPEESLLQTFLMSHKMQRMLKKACWLNESTGTVVLIPLQSSSFEMFSSREDYLKSFNSSLHDAGFTDSYLADGGVADSVYSLKDAYDRALLALKMGKKLYPPGSICWHEKLSIYNLFNGVDKKEELIRFSKKMLSPLLQNDVHFNAIETLDIYLKSGCSLEKTAKILFLHKNTLRYRIGKIRELLDNDLGDPDVELNLRIALIIHQLFQ